MAIFLGKDCSIVVNSVNLSDHAFSARVGGTTEQVDISTFNATGTKAWLAGQSDEEIVIGFLQDYDAGKINATLGPLFRNKTSFTVVCKPTSGAVSPTNPSWTATVQLFDYAYMDVTVGQRSEVPVTFKVTSGSIVEATA